MRIKNWKLNLIALLCVTLLTSLGYWQLSRANEKKQLVQTFTHRSSQILKVEKLQQLQDLRFYQTELSGHFDNAHTILLDNKILHGKVGYEIYTPFYADELSQPILIDRGFVGIQTSRQEHLAIPPILGKVHIRGILNLPPRYVAFGKISDGPPNWPLRVEYIQLKELAHAIQIPLLFNYVLSLPAEHTPYNIDWQITTIPPERHMAYAVQWFALALTLLILSVALNFNHNKYRTNPKK